MAHDQTAFSLGAVRSGPLMTSFSLRKKKKKILPDVKKKKKKKI